MFSVCRICFMLVLVIWMFSIWVMCVWCRVMVVVVGRLLVLMVLVIGVGVLLVRFRIRWVVYLIVVCGNVGFMFCLKWCLVLVCRFSLWLWFMMVVGVKCVVFRNMVVVLLVIWVLKLFIRLVSVIGWFVLVIIRKLLFSVVLWLLSSFMDLLVCEWCMLMLFCRVFRL